MLKDSIENHYHISLNDSQAIEIALEHAAITADAEPSRLYLTIDSAWLLSEEAKAAMQKAQDEKFEKQRKRSREEREAKQQGESG